MVLITLAIGFCGSLDISSASDVKWVDNGIFIIIFIYTQRVNVSAIK
jgi:hypothetical protein